MTTTSAAPAARTGTVDGERLRRNEGGELGYSLMHAYGAAFDNPDLVVAGGVAVDDTGDDNQSAGGEDAMAASG